MSETTTVRLDAEELALLRSRAEREGVRPATLAASLIRQGLSEPEPDAPADGEVVSGVLASFGDRTGSYVGVQREVALTLARRVEAGGTAGSDAGIRLMRLLDVVRDSEEGSFAEWSARMSIPVHTHCQRCRNEMRTP